MHCITEEQWNRLFRSHKGSSPCEGNSDYSKAKVNIYKGFGDETTEEVLNGYGDMAAAAISVYGDFIERIDVDVDTSCKLVFVDTYLHNATTLEQLTKFFNYLEEV